MNIYLEILHIIENICLLKCRQHKLAMACLFPNLILSQNLIEVHMTFDKFYIFLYTGG